MLIHGQGCSYSCTKVVCTSRFYIGTTIRIIITKIYFIKANHLYASELNPRADS